MKSSIKRFDRDVEPQLLLYITTPPGSPDFISLLCFKQMQYSMRSGTRILTKEPKKLIAGNDTVTNNQSMEKVYIVENALKARKYMPCLKFNGV